MAKSVIMAVVVTAGGALLLASSAWWQSVAVIYGQMKNARTARSFQSGVETYQNWDAKRLAAHETPAVEVVDRK